MSEEVKACPFCGSKELECGTFKAYAPVAGRYFVHCRKCQCSGPLGKRYESKDLDHNENEGIKDAVRQWNKRVERSKSSGRKKSNESK